MDLFEIVYTSYSTLKFNEINNLIDKSIIRNKINGITGCLLVSGTEFFQIIEGEKQQVLALFEKIKHDNRHSRIKLMWSSSIEDRAFGKWEMLCKEIPISTLHLTGKATTGKELLEIIKNTVH